MITGYEIKALTIEARSLIKASFIEKKSMKDKIVMGRLFKAVWDGYTLNLNFTKTARKLLKRAGLSKEESLEQIKKIVSDAGIKLEDVKIEVVENDG